MQQFFLPAFAKAAKFPQRFPKREEKQAERRKKDTKKKAHQILDKPYHAVADGDDPVAERQKIQPHAAEQPEQRKKTHLARIGTQKNPEHQKNSGQPEKRVLRLYPESLMVQAVAKHTQTVI